MTCEEFNRQYEQATSNGARILDELCCGAYFGSLSAEKLWEALVERIEEEINIEESEMKTILCEIAERLGRLEEMEAAETHATAVESGER